MVVLTMHTATIRHAHTLYCSSQSSQWPWHGGLAIFSWQSAERHSASLHAGQGARAAAMAAW